MAINMQTCLNDCLSQTPDCLGKSRQSGCFIDEHDSIDTDAIESALKSEDFRSKVVDCVFLYAKKYATFADNFYNEICELDANLHSGSVISGHSGQVTISERLNDITEKGKAAERLADIYVVLYKYLTGRDVEFRCKPRFEEVLNKMEDNEILEQLDKVVDDVNNSQNEASDKKGNVSVVNSESSVQVHNNSEKESAQVISNNPEKKQQDERDSLESDYIKYKEDAGRKHNKKVAVRIIICVAVLLAVGSFVYFYAVPKAKNNPKIMESIEKLSKSSERTVNKFKQRVLGIDINKADVSKKASKAKKAVNSKVSQSAKKVEKAVSNTAETVKEEVKKQQGKIVDSVKEVPVEEKPVLEMPKQLEPSVAFSQIGDRTCCEITVGDIDIIAIISGNQATISYPDTVTKKQAWKAMSAVYSALGKSMSNTSISILNDGSASIVFPDNASEESIEAAFKVVADVIKDLVK